MTNPASSFATSYPSSAPITGNGGTGWYFPARVLPKLLHTGAMRKKKEGLTVFSLLQTVRLSSRYAFQLWIKPSKAEHHIVPYCLSLDWPKLSLGWLQNVGACEVSQTGAEDGCTAHTVGSCLLKVKLRGFTSRLSTLNPSCLTSCGLAFIFFWPFDCSLLAKMNKNWIGISQHDQF